MNPLAKLAKMLMVKRTPGTAIRSRQGGSMLVELSLATMLAALVTLYSMPQSVKEAQDASIDAAGAQAVALKGALDKYLVQNHDGLAAGSAVAGFANPLAPTIAELVTAKYLSSTFRSTITRRDLPLAIQVTTSNCPGSTCDLQALAYTTRPLTAQNSGEIRFDLVARFLAATQGYGASSKYGDGGVIRSNVFNAANPIGNVPGIIAIGTNLDQGMYNLFVRMNESRDVTFQNNFTVGGNITGKGNLAISGNASVKGTLTGSSSMGTSDGSAPCMRASLETNGTVISRDPNCVTRVQLNADGSVYSSDASGAIRAGFNYNASGESQVFADNLLNNAGTAGIKSDGTVFGKFGVFSNLTLNNSASVGASCSPDNSAAWGSVGPNLMWLKCQGGTWQAVGTTVATANSACVTEGVTGMDPSGVQLYCQGGTWVTTANRFGMLTIMQRFYSGAGTVVPKPTCPANGSPRIYNIPQIAQTNQQYFNFRFVDNGTSWTLKIDNLAGQDANGLGLVETICAYV